MSVITIPKKITRGKELVIIPRQNYEEYLQLRKIIPIIKMNRMQKRDLSHARREYKKGQFIKLEELGHELGINSKKKGKDHC